MSARNASIINRPAEARRHHRHAVQGGGRLLLDGATEHRCRILDISPGGAALATPSRGEVGERVICYLDDFGRIEGRVARLFDGGFAVEFKASTAKREKLTDQLAWHAKRGQPEPAGHRSHARIVPLKTRAILHLPDGRHIAAQLIDVSMSGAALTCPVLLSIGTAVVLGRRPAHVTRVAQRLIGVEFVTAIPATEFDDTIEL